MKKIKFQDTSFRDGFQSIFGARVFAKDFMPAVEAAVKAGITHFEAGGGARFQALYQNCGEDAFDMMDEFRRRYQRGGPRSAAARHDQAPCRHVQEARHDPYS